jgi:hypothetical protein
MVDSFRIPRVGPLSQIHENSVTLSRFSIDIDLICYECDGNRAWPLYVARLIARNSDCQTFGLPARLLTALTENADDAFVSMLNAACNSGLRRFGVRSRWHDHVWRRRPGVADCFR